MAFENLRTEDSVLAVVGVCLLGRLKLVKLEDIIDEFLFTTGGSAGWVGALR